MKNFFPITAVLLLLAVFCEAQIPRTLSYQGVLADSLGNPKPDGSYNLTFRLYDAESSGSVLWTEAKTLDVKRGLFTTVLGDQVIFGPTIKFDKQYWLSIQVASQPELSPRIPLTSVGYSLYSLRTDTAQFALTTLSQGYVDSARIAGTVPVNSISSIHIVDQSINRDDVVPTFTSPLADSAAIAGTIPINSINDMHIIDGAVIRNKIADSSIIGQKIGNNQIVRSINDMKDNLILTAQGGATITSLGDTIVINAGSGAGGDSTGIWGIQNTNNTLDIFDPNGPTTTINVKFGGIREGHIADSSIIQGKIAPNSVSGNEVADGSITNFDISDTAKIEPQKIFGNAWTSHNDGHNTGLDADMLDGLHASAFQSSSTDYGRQGVADTLYEGSSALAQKYVNTIGPETMYGNTGSTLMSIASGSSSSDLFAISGYGNNPSSGNVYSGYFSTSDSGTGAHWGIAAYSNANSNSIVYGCETRATNLSTGSAYGVLSTATNQSTGSAYGGMFGVTGYGTGIHYGVYSDAWGSSSNYTMGTYSRGVNFSTGYTYGGYFTADSSGTGIHVGVYGEGLSNTIKSARGVQGYGVNTSSGPALGGYFEATAAGSGNHYGIQAISNGLTLSKTYGVYGLGSNSADGDVYGGVFETASQGTGEHIGVAGRAWGSAENIPVYGVRGFGSNTSSGNVYGGYFTTSSEGTGYHYGIYGEATGSHSGWGTLPVIGVYGKGKNYTGTAIGGYFEADTAGTGHHYGVMGHSEKYRGTGDCFGGRFTAQNFTYTAGDLYGLLARAWNWGSDAVYGSYIDAYGAGTTYGTYIDAIGESDSTTYGVYSHVRNSSKNASVCAGYFETDTTGNQDAIGIWAKSPGNYNIAGYFDGYLVSSHTKSAVVQTNNNDYRKVYSQESPEVWFEDFGEGQLINGKTRINLDPIFLQTVTIDEQHPMKVFIQLRDDCKGTYVRSYDDGFDVIELQGGTSNAEFSYRVVAKRKGYEDVRLESMNKFMSSINKASLSNQKRSEDKRQERDFGNRQQLHSIRIDNRTEDKPPEIEKENMNEVRETLAKEREKEQR